MYLWCLFPLLLLLSGNWCWIAERHQLSCICCWWSRIDRSYSDDVTRQTEGNAIHRSYLLLLFCSRIFIEDLRLLNNVHVCYIMLFLVSVVTGWRLTNLTVNFKLLRLTRGFPDVSEETIYDSRSSIIQLNVVVDTSCWNCRGWRDLYICSAVPLRIDILIT